ncbi:MAG: AIR carboxylase family protein [Lentisphaeria bacterium]|nr:AIR carboxylase family protein [Lentisphaeria bacterium]
MENDTQTTSAAQAPAENAGAGGCFRLFPGRIRGDGKSAEELKRTLRRLLTEHESVIATGVEESAGAALVTAFPGGEYDPCARVFLMPPAASADSGVFIVTAGDEDLPAALEARYALAACGAAGTLVRTAGTSDPLSLAGLSGRLSCAAACIAVAGTDSALPGAVAGLVKAPVIALPANLPRGGFLGGWAVLPGILGSGAPGLAVVAPGDGAGAGFAAARIVSREQAEQGTKAEENNIQEQKI